MFNDVLSGVGMESGDKFSVKTFSDIVNLENKRQEKTPE